jgi:hypothetical protein
MAGRERKLSADSTARFEVLTFSACVFILFAEFMPHSLCGRQSFPRVKTTRLLLNLNVSNSSLYSKAHIKDRTGPEVEMRSRRPNTYLGHLWRNWLKTQVN